MADDASSQRTEAANLRTSVQWIIAAAGGLTAVLIARIPAVDPASLSTTGLVITNLLLTIAACLAGTVLYLAAQVLTVAHLPASHIGTREQTYRTDLKRQLRPPPELIAGVLEAQRSELLGAYESIDEALEAKRTIHARLTRAAEPMEPDERELLLAQLSDVDRRLGDVRAAVQYETSLERHRRLLRALPRLGLGIVASLLCYVFITSFFAAPHDRISSPTPVAVHITDLAAAGMPTSCPHQRFGFAIAGSREAPLVLLEPQSSTCPGQTLTAGPGDAITWINHP